MTSPNFLELLFAPPPPCSTLYFNDWLQFPPPPEKWPSSCLSLSMSGAVLLGVPLPHCPTPVLTSGCCPILCANNQKLGTFESPPWPHCQRSSFLRSVDCVCSQTLTYVFSLTTSATDVPVAECSSRSQPILLQKEVFSCYSKIIPTGNGELSQ